MSVLTHPRYAVVGQHLGAMRDELHDTLARDLALEFLPRGEQFFEDLEVSRLSLTLSAVQHARLVTVPLTFTLAISRIDEVADTWRVWVPGLALQFSLTGRDSLEAWTTERIRGALHLEPVKRLLQCQAAPRERVDPLMVRWHGTSRYEKQLRASRITKAAEAARTARPALGGVGIDLVQEARDGRLPRALERRAEVDQLIAALVRRRDRAAVLVGPPGVGKTALVHELAHRIANHKVPQKLEGESIWHVSGNALMAGMTYVGQWQQRAMGIANHLTRTGGILYVGGLLELLQAGSGRGGLNAAQLFLPFLDRNAFPLLAEATPDALVRGEQVHGPFVRSLQRLVVPGMSRDTALGVLRVLAQRMARSSGTRVDDEALATAIEVLARFGQADALPGSGLALVESMVRAHAGTQVGRAQAIGAYVESSGFPSSIVDVNADLDEREVREHFEQRVVGQPEAARVLSQLILVVKAGLQDPSKPLGSLLLLGPTGVGKTESAKALAAWLFGSPERLVRFDMSEFAAFGSARRLVEGPQGQGLLTRRVREQPFCVLLFDEIEKAEPGVFDVLLQVLGEARLTDGAGATVSFRHTIVILTSNLGATTTGRVGLVAPDREELVRHYRKSAEQFFRPEFVNRLDHLVPYGSLGPDTIRVIAGGLLDQALRREGFRRRGITVGWGEDLIEHLVQVGYEPSLGARPMRRAIETEVLAPLSALLARGEVKDCKVQVEVVDGTVRATGPSVG